MQFKKNKIKIKGISYILSSRQKHIDMLLLQAAKELFHTLQLP